MDATTNDTQDRAEQLDGNALGERPSDHELPGINDHADRRTMHSEDPALLMGGSETEDDLRTRIWREESGLESPTATDDGMRLAETETDTPELADDEGSAIATRFDADEPTAEEAAMHLTDPPATQSPAITND